SFHNEFRCPRSDLRRPLIDGSQRHSQHIRVMNISRANHGDVIGYVKPGFENRFHGPNRYRIVVTKYSIRNWTQFQEAARSVIPAVICVSSRDHVSRLYLQTTFLQRKMVSLHSFRRDPDVWTAQVCNTTAPLFDELVCR